MGKRTDNDAHYSPDEAAQRRDAIVRNMIAMPPQKQESLNAKKRSVRAPKRRPKSG